MVGDLEVAARDDVLRVLALLVGTRDPGGAGGDARVGDVADLLQALRADVAAYQVGAALEVLGGDELDDGGGEVLAELAEVDLAVARHAHGHDLAVDLDQQVLQGRGGRDAEVRGERLDGRGVGGVQLLDGAVRRAVRGGGLEGHGLGVGGVVAGGAVDEGVLTGRGGREELLGRRAAHGAGDGGDDAVVEAEPLEDPDVGGAVQLVRLGETLVGGVEGVRVLHLELAAAQHAGPGRASSRYLVWIW